jgi:hypothetical protein
MGTTPVVFLLLFLSGIYGQTGLSVVNITNSGVLKELGAVALDKRTIPPTIVFAGRDSISQVIFEIPFYNL